nr:immunoglobulin light chain junction region [Macaca mulatta]
DYYCYSYTTSYTYIF